MHMLRRNARAAPTCARQVQFNVELNLALPVVLLAERGGGGFARR